MKTPNEKEFIASIVKASVMAYAEGFECRHVGEYDNPEGVINMKIHNVFIEAIGKDSFSNCTNLRSIVYEGLNNPCQEKGFDNCGTNHVYVKENVYKDNDFCELQIIKI